MLDSILGIDHVGLGVRDMRRMTSFYTDVFSLRVIASMPEEDHPAIHGLLRSRTAIHSSCLLAGQAGGLTLSLFHAIDPPSRPIRADHRYGDIGVAKLTFFVADLPAFCRAHAAAFDVLSPERVVELAGWGEYRFAYAADPEGNLVELVSAADTASGPSRLLNSDAAPSGHDRRARDKDAKSANSSAICVTEDAEARRPACSGGRGFVVQQPPSPLLGSAGVAVTDLERSLDFYRSSLGLNEVLIAPHECFSGLVDELTGHRSSHVLSCLIGSSRGTGMLELVEVTKPRGRSMPFGTQWGDFGYLQLCLYGTDGQRLAAQVESERLDVILPLQTIDDPEFPAQFMYLRDPDGVPLEVLVYPPDRRPGGA